MARTVLVTGGGGFIGRAIVMQLLARGDSVRVYARGSYPELASMGIHVIHGDISDLPQGRESLASDLLETIRPLADRLCLGLVRKQTLTSDHFSTCDAGCLLGKAGRSRYYAAYEEYSEVLRAGIQAEVEAVASRVGAAPRPPAVDGSRDMAFE